MKRILPKKEIGAFIKDICSKYKVYAPVRNNGFTLFQEIRDFSEVDLESNTRIPPKSILFKQTETLFTFTPGKKPRVDPVDVDKEKIVIFGIRPCDARSLSILDMVFKKDYLDPFYIKRRENTILLGLSCNTPDVNCFCTTFEDGKMHVDALFTDIGDKYLIEVSSEKGKEITEKLSLAKKEEKKITKAKIIDIKGITEKLDEIFNSDLWKKIAMKCLGCGICTYLCPTCHCFDIQDESTLTNGARLRIWDSCMREEYTLQASGYNPRPLRMDRMKNRIYHKFNYFPKNFNVFACVGCGRCIDNCPVNTNIIDVIDSIKKEGG